MASAASATLTVALAGSAVPGLGNYGLVSGENGEKELRNIKTGRRNEFFVFDIMFRWCI